MDIMLFSNIDFPEEHNVFPIFLGYLKKFVDRFFLNLHQNLWTYFSQTFLIFLKPYLCQNSNHY